MLLFFERVRTVVRANEQGPRIYLKPLYAYYHSLLSNQLRDMALHVFTQPALPALRLFECLMAKLKAVADECFFLADFVPLNLMTLDCRRVNRILINMVHEVQEAVTNYFKALTIKENRR